MCSYASKLSSRRQLSKTTATESDFRHSHYPKSLNRACCIIPWEHFSSKVILAFHTHLQSYSQLSCSTLERPSRLPRPTPSQLSTVPILAMSQQTPKGGRVNRGKAHRPPAGQQTPSGQQGSFVCRDRLAEGTQQKPHSSPLKRQGNKEGRRDRCGRCKLFEHRENTDGMVAINDGKDYDGEGRGCEDEHGLCECYEWKQRKVAMRRNGYVEGEEPHEASDEEEMRSWLQERSKMDVW